jgi:peptidoglycan/LPS O-acetylase OafA/YrhL
MFKHYFRCNLVQTVMRKVQALQWLRFAAATHLVYGHYFEWVHHSNNLMQWYYVETGLFFFLSGYLLELRYTNTTFTKLTTLRFLYQRISAIYPLYLVALIVELFHWPREQPWWVVLATATCTQAWFPSIGLTNLNYPTWALSTIIAFYLLYPLIHMHFLLQIRSDKILFHAAVGIYCTWTAFIVCFVVAAPEDSLQLRHPVHNLLCYGPVGFLTCFITGCIAGRLSLNKFSDEFLLTHKYSSLYMLTMFMLIMTSYAPPNPDVPGNAAYLAVRSGGLVPVYWSLLWCLSNPHDLVAGWLDNARLSPISELSFCLFIFQQPVHELSRRIFSPDHVGVGFTLLLYLVCAGGQHLVQSPLMQWLRSERVLRFLRLHNECTQDTSSQLTSGP